MSIVDERIHFQAQHDVSYETLYMQLPKTSIPAMGLPFDWHMPPLPVSNPNQDWEP